MKQNETQTEKMGEYMRTYLMNFEHLPCGLAVVKNDASATILQANPAFYSMIGYTEEQFQACFGNRMQEVFLDKSHPMTTELATETDCDSQWDFQVNRGDGRMAWLHNCIHYHAELDVSFFIVTDISAQKELESKNALQKTLHDCIEAMFTITATNGVEETTYYDMLSRIKQYYHADRAFFYKFKDKTNEVDTFYEVSVDGVKKVEQTLPFVVPDYQLQLIQALSTANTAQVHSILDSLEPEYHAKLMKLHEEYAINNFSCVVVNNVQGDIVAYMGVINPQLHEDNKELMELLSRFICLFIEHQQDDNLKEEALKLEAISKANVVEACVKNFQDVSDSAENVVNTLDALCQHYDADFTVVLLKQADGACEISHVGGPAIPSLTAFQSQGVAIMEKWNRMFGTQPQVASSVDFDALNQPAVQKILEERFGILNFIVAPIQDAQGALLGLLFVNNFKLKNRAHLMVHVVAKNISDYWERIRMHHQTNQEPLTKLANKVATKSEISRLLEQGMGGTLFIVDIDNFKGLNDTLGHQVGDQAIVEFATNLKQIFRATDVIGRIGGDEFMVFSPSLTAEGLIAQKAHQILEKCDLCYQKGGESTRISASIGICLVDENCRTFQALYEKADRALYTSKHNGKNQYHMDIATQ